MLLLLLACAPVDVCQESPDLDGDGLSDCQEAELGGDPMLVDSDGEGFDDGEAPDCSSDPLSADFSETTKFSRCQGGLFLDSPTDRWGRVTDIHGAFNTGLYNIDDEGAYPGGEPGLIAQTGREKDTGVYRTPSLCNAALTGSWDHDGSLASIQEMVGSYTRGGRLLQSGANAGDGATNPYKSKHIQGFESSESQTEDLLTFLHALSDQKILEDPHFQSPFCLFDSHADTGSSDTGRLDYTLDSRPTDLRT
jgi:cytochrome c peroxidase